MAKSTCSVDGCARHAHGAGYCRMHWDRWRRTGDPGPLESTRGRYTWTVNDDGCWIWDRAKASTGYGVLRPNGTLLYAHRWSYERHVGPIPEGLHVDHLCCVRACINPAHLEPVTHAENMRRKSERRTRCDRGHELTPDNLTLPPHLADLGRRGLCRDCAAIRRRDRYARLGNQKIAGTRLWWTIMFRDGQVCQYCGDAANTVDHVVPRSVGGTDDPGNLVASCRPCNLKKGTTLREPMAPPAEALAAHVECAAAAHRRHKYPPKGRLAEVIRAFAQ